MNYLHTLKMQSSAGYEQLSPVLVELRIYPACWRQKHWYQCLVYQFPPPT
jgi:hypothetical protein